MHVYIAAFLLFSLGKVQRFHVLEPEELGRAEGVLAATEPIFTSTPRYSQDSRDALSHRSRNASY